MDSFDFDNVKAEKAKAMLRYNRVRNFAKIVEVCVALLLLSWSSSHLPVAVKTSAEYLREISVLLLSTPAIFVIGNVIIITLVAQSGKLPGQNRIENDTGEDIYDEYVRIKEESQPRIVVSDVKSPAPEENTYEDKQMIVSSENAVSPVHEEPVTAITTTVPEKATATKPYRRTQSETFQRTLDKSRKALRRSETEKYRPNKSSGEKPARLSNAVDKLSNEEFQRTIDAFIERQQRFLRQEYMSVVLTNDQK